jgi:cytoskeletal protein RodZ
MSIVSAQLRSAREARNLTVEEVADLTKVRTDHIRALEEGRFNVFSATVYIRGSIKAYAKLLKLDDVKLLSQLDGELKSTQKFSEPPPLVEAKKSFMDSFAFIVAKLNWKMGLAGVGIIALALVAGLIFFAVKHHPSSDPLKNLPPAVYSPANSGDTLPLPK